MGDRKYWFVFPSNRHIEKINVEHRKEIKNTQNYSGFQPLVPVFSGARSSHQDLRTAMVMSVARGEIRFARSSGKIEFPRLWFPCDAVTLLCVALKEKDKYHCLKFSGDFRIWCYWFSIYFLGYCALCWIDQTLNSLVSMWFLKLWVFALKFLLWLMPTTLFFLLLILARLRAWNKLCKRSETWISFWP